jgi:hypothetical protein
MSRSLSRSEQARLRAGAAQKGQILVGLTVDQLARRWRAVAFAVCVESRGVSKVADVSSARLGEKAWVSSARYGCRVVGQVAGSRLRLCARFLEV